MMQKTSAQKETAQREAKSLKKPRIHWSFESVRYNSENKTVELFVTPHFFFSIAIGMVHELNQVSENNLSKMYLTPSGETLVVEEADVYISVNGLLFDLAKELSEENQKTFLVQ